MKKIFVNLFMIGILLLTNNVYAENEIEINTEYTKNESVEYIDKNELMNEITERLEAIANSDNNELKENTSEIMEKYSSNWIVRLFQKLIDAISSFIESILKMASEAAKVGVD